MPESKPLEIRMVGLPKSLHERVVKEAHHRRMSTRELMSEMVRDWFEFQDGMFNGEFENEDYEQEVEWY